ncbi:hypothetical protein NSMM_360025 [Nitrosomonas mobilis]|uniref:Uncharacterized protein n=1 Tax=Nitrosomonas mobilis TaxID=51642 RepID=A0A1G5SED2_9PROT|nr:hypothetical protein NSMM_360025 [Nitrosomonas mobilis]
MILVHIVDYVIVKVFLYAVREPRLMLEQEKDRAKLCVLANNSQLII